MEIPELFGKHKIAIFSLIATIVVILLLSLSANKDVSQGKDKKEPDTAKPSSVNKRIPERKKETKKSEVSSNPEMVSVEQLFAPYKRRTGTEPPQKMKKPISVKQFAKMIIGEIDSFPKKDFKVIRKALLNAENLNIGTIGLEFIYSKSKKLQTLGFELITKACINKTEFFKPNKFFMVFAQKGFASEPFITEIIENTNDDFCREWACELYVEIFYHNTDNSDSRHRKLSKVKQKEQKIYQKIENLFSDEKRVEELIKSKRKLGDEIRRSWGKENRYSIKLLVIIKYLDNLNDKNQYATTQKILKIIRKYSFHYDILNRIDGKPIKRPAIPDQIKLKYLSNAIFQGKNTNTFKWLQKKDGGFTSEELKEAVKNNNIEQIKRMNKIFHNIISSILRGKLLLGFGNHELELLRYFYYASWDKKAFKWEDNMITVHNMKGEAAPLLLLQKPDINGEKTKKSNGEDTKEEFYVPPQSVFVWFAGDGEYILSVNRKNKVLKPENLLNFDDKKFSINKNNITFDIF